jgi:hypothetical protein
MTNATFDLDAHELHFDSMCIFAEPFGDLCKCKSLEVEVGYLSFAFREVDHCLRATYHSLVFTDAT